MLTLARIILTPTNLTCTSLMLAGFLQLLGAAEMTKYDYRLLATTKTSTMEKELDRRALPDIRFLPSWAGTLAWEETKWLL